MEVSKIVAEWLSDRFHIYYLAIAEHKHLCGDRVPMQQCIYMHHFYDAKKYWDEAGKA